MIFMNIKGTLKALGAKAYKNRALIETVVGMGCVVGGTAIVISKAKQATKVAEELDARNTYIHKQDAEDLWLTK